MQENEVGDFSLAKAYRPMSDLSGKMGRKIAAARDDLGYSQEEFCKIADIDRSNLSLIETGRVDVRISTVQRIAKALGTTLEQFFRELG